MSRPLLRLAFPARRGLIFRQRTQLLPSYALSLKHSTRTLSTFRTLLQEPALADANSAQADEAPISSQGGGPITQFQDLAEKGLVSAKIIKNLVTDMNLKDMTEVQSRTIAEGLKGVDVLAQAKTGTGKTLAFLIPLIQRILESDSHLLDRPSARTQMRCDIRAIIVSPTRELAEQIADQVRKVIVGTGLRCQAAVGGTQKRSHLQKMHREGCHILVGTPGRLKDILSDPEARVSAPKLDALVLDEADRLMDDGFWPEIQQIQQLLPTKTEKDRQTLLFSATIPREVISLAHGLLKPGYHHVQAVQKDEDPTHARVPQKLVIADTLVNVLPSLLEVLEQAQTQCNEKGVPLKAIVYCSTTAETKLTAALMNEVRYQQRKATPRDQNIASPRVFSIHSRLTQAGRTKAANDFRAAASAVLVSSDVTARGMDFPKVTHVIQLGVPQTKDAYIHRIGRTARAGAEGEAWLIVPAIAVRTMRQRLGGLPLRPEKTIEAAGVHVGSEDAEISEMDLPKGHRELYTAAQNLREPEIMVDAYRSWFGQIVTYKPQEFVQEVNQLARIQWGMARPPTIRHAIARNLGILRVPGINIEKRQMESADDMGYPPRRSSTFGDRSRFSGDSRSERGGFSSRRSSPFGSRERSARYDFSNYSGRNQRESRSNDRW